MGYHARACSSVHFSSEVWFQLIIWCYKKGVDVMIDSCVYQTMCSWSVALLGMSWTGVQKGNSILQRLLLHRFWPQMIPMLDWNHWIWDSLASFLCSGRKWRRLVHLYIQSLIWGHKPCDCYNHGRLSVDPYLYPFDCGFESLARAKGGVPVEMGEWIKINTQGVLAVVFHCGNL